MKIRSVSEVATAVRTHEGAGFPVRRPFPTRTLEDVDPFLLLDEMGPADHGPGEAKGAPDHPHRGFETVTYMLAGGMQHRDSAGNSGKIGPGDVQWMTAGSGVIHSELPVTEIMQKGGRQHGFQLWVNLPKKDKMTAPRYQEIPAAKIPVGKKDGVAVRVIAGEALGAKAVIDTKTPIQYLHATLQPGASWEHAVGPEFRAFVYVFSGEADVAARRVKDGQLAVLGNDGDGIAISNPAKAPAEVLLVAGVPLGEPVARYGPFVMNTEEEIEQAFVDYQAGKFVRKA
jgi:redox-sensitive bicupin YhaK (pirin superfamily)